MSVAEKIKAYLEENGISQTHISRKASIPIVKLNLSLNGNRRMTFEEYEKICWVLGLGVDTFLEPKEPSNVSDKERGL